MTRLRDPEQREFGWHYYSREVVVGMTTGRTRLLHDLAVRACALVQPGRRAVLGIAGAPGAGKSTLATALVEAIREGGVLGGDESVVHLPMDGFHLADVQLSRLGLLQQKGAPETFDAAGYTSTLSRIVADPEEVVYAPSFDRRLEQPVAGSIAVTERTRLVVTEGNYLLADGPWAGVRSLLDEAWFVELPDEQRRQRLVERHQRFGKPPELALEWAHVVDQRNAEIVARTRHGADLVVVPEEQKVQVVVQRSVS